MFKFLRKYNTWILAVGGTLLMIAFLIPQAIQSLSQRAAMSQATTAIVDGRSVTPVEWGAVQEEVSALQQMSRAVGSTTMFLDPVVGNITEPDRWFLLTYEAEQAGLVGNRPAGLTDEQLLQTASLFQISPSVMSRTYAKISAVNTLIDLYRRSTTTADNRARRFAQQLFHESIIQTVVLRADAENSTYEPTEAEILEQFEKYKDLNPGEGDHGFGYKLPNRIKLEWIEIPSEPIRTAISTSDKMNGIALRHHWRENENQRGIPAVTAGADIPEVVREDLLTQLTNERLDEISRFAHDQLRLRQQQLDQRDGLFIVPDDWATTRMAFPELAEQIRDRFEVDLPKYEAIGDRWVPIAELAEIGQVAGARSERFGQRLNIQGMLNLSTEFGGDGTATIQTGVAGPPLQATLDQSVYLFRVTDTDLSRVPNNVDEVRDEIVTDLKRMADYQSLLARASDLEQTAEANGLVALAMRNETDVNRSSRVALYNPQAYQIQKILRRQGQGAFEVTASPIPGLGADTTAQQDDEALKQIIDYTMEFGPDLADFSTTPESERVFTVPSETHLALVVVRLMAQRPLSEQRYQTMVEDGDLGILLISDQFAKGETIRDAFTLEALSKRHNFERTGRNEEDGTDGDVTAVADASSDG